MLNKLILILICISACATQPRPVVVVPPTAPIHNLAMDYEKLMEKYNVLPKATCIKWEETPSTQSVICEVNPQIAVYCLSASGQMPSCKLAIDLRPAPAKDATETPTTPTTAPVPPKSTNPKH